MGECNFGKMCCSTSMHGWILIGCLPNIEAPVLFCSVKIKQPGQNGVIVILFLNIFSSYC